MPLKACAYRKRGMMLLPRGIERCSVRVGMSVGYYFLSCIANYTEQFFCNNNAVTVDN